jgi:polysaccharide pyruvyl transferase WcaK-like protein
MKILICGFYGHKNLGDDFYQLAFDRLLSGSFQLTFQELSEIDKVDLTLYDAVVVGGGDLMNDFYGLKYEEVLSSYQGYKIAISVGFSFQDCTKRKYISYFDDIVMRSKRDLYSVNKIIGSIHTHYMSDLAFNIPFVDFSPNDLMKDGTGKNVGYFLVGSLLDNPSFMFPLLSFTNFLITNGYIIHLIPMHTEEGNNSNDLRINDCIFRTFNYTGNIVNHPDIQSFDSLQDALKMIDYGLCIRYHGHVFCTRYGIPFLSIPITRKTEIFIDEIPYDTKYGADVKFDLNYNVTTFDTEDLKHKFNSLVANYTQIRKSLLFYAGICCSDKNKLISLLTNRIKRKVASQELILLEPEAIYNKYLQLFSSKGVNIFTDKLTDMPEIISQQWINDTADNICYDLTKDPANDFNYGTRINLTESPHKLRDIIYYIYQVNLEKTEHPKINMNYIKQDSFRGLHRAGWQYAIDSLYCYSGDHGVLLDTYLDRTFGWASNVLTSSGIIPYTNYWVGFLHHTFETEFSGNNCEALFSCSNFISSLPLCIGIFCLTDYLADLVRRRLMLIGFGNIKVESLHHPTVFPNLLFDVEAFSEDPKVINIGSWYRNPVTINVVANHCVGDTNFKFQSLKGKRMNSNFCPDSFTVTFSNGEYQCNDNIWTRYFIKYVNGRSDEYSSQLFELLSEDRDNHEGQTITKEELQPFLQNVEVLEELKNGEYDLLLSKTVVFLDLVDASTANTILECIVRETPLIVNKIPPTVELMGEDYPLFYTSIQEAVGLMNIDKIREGIEYMKTMDKERYRIDNFVDSFVSSDIYKAIST